MLPSSHAVPMECASVATLPDAGFLADAFAEFISASSVLEASYRDLQREVAQLGSELSERNAALTRSLAENERMKCALEQILDSLPCGVLVLNDARRVEMINPEGRRLLELPGLGAGDLPETARFGQVDFASLVDHAGGEIDTELRTETDSGPRWLAVSSRNLISASDSQSDGYRIELQTVWILRDVTAAKLAEQERESARRAVALAEIATILAHEIRNPLGSLELFAELIEQDRENAGQWISHLRAGIRTLSGIVNNVLSLNGESKPKLAPVDVVTCVRRGVEFVQPVAEQAGVALDFAGEESGLRILGNEDAVCQIVLNLVSNAIRHTAAGGRVTVTARHRIGPGARKAMVEVSDTGYGIPEHLIERIFEPGFSGTGETSGLGLAVCKRLLDAHGGGIRVVSRPGAGSNFQLEFPLI